MSYLGYRSSPPLMMARADVRLATAHWKAHLSQCAPCRRMESGPACMAGESLLHSLGLAHERLSFESRPFLYFYDVV